MTGQKQVMSEQKHVWQDNMTGTCPAIIWSPAVIDIVIVAIAELHVDFSFYVQSFVVSNNVMIIEIAKIVQIAWPFLAVIAIF